MIKHASTASAAKRVAPFLSRSVDRVRARGAVDKLVTYLNFVNGQGAGTGWDEGEFIVAAEQLRGVQGPVVVDCGANRGQWTIGVRELLGHARGTWILLEPTAELVGQLERLPNVEVIAAAVGEAHELRDFHVPTTASGWMSLHERGDTFSQSKDFRKRQVQTVRLDEELVQRGIDHIDYLKMDVEGHELFVLKGLGRFLEERRVDALSFEFGAADVNSRCFFRDFWELLVPFGYHIARIAPGGRCVPVPEYYENLEFFRGATNYVAIAR